MERQFVKRLGTVTLAALVLSSSLVQAQERRGRGPEREHERVRYHTPHWVFDNRFHHDHYYPEVGYAVDVLPPGNLAITFRGGRFWFNSGVWYQHIGPRYVVVRPPVGVIVPLLPPGYTAVYFGGVPYYYANDVYYAQQPTGYQVVAPPETAQAQPAPAAPPGTAPAPAPGVWYYCDSAKGYYPYVSQCAEGWRTVPATPPSTAPR